MPTGAEERTDEQRWSVGELAGELGVTPRTLRFYEAKGLITPARAGANRVYGPRDRAQMRLILRGRRFGMTLAECREIVDMYDGAASSEQRQLTTLLARLDEVGRGSRAAARGPGPHAGRGHRRGRAVPLTAGAAAPRRLVAAPRRLAMAPLPAGCFHPACGQWRPRQAGTAAPAPAPATGASEAARRPARRS